MNVEYQKTKSLFPSAFIIRCWTFIFFSFDVGRSSVIIMIDIHAHILPGLDDGPATTADALEMARMAVEDGIRIIIAAPHCLNGIFNNYREGVMSACSEFNLTLEKEHIPLEVLPGSEVHLDMEILDDLERGRLMTLNDTGRYFFLELPDQFIPRTLVGFIARLEKMNVTPIIAHPERNMAIQRNTTLLEDLISAGALSQITARSLTGGFGPPALQCCLRIIELNLAHFMASDAHSPGTRPPILSRAVKKHSALTSKMEAERMVFEAPMMVIEGREPEP